MFRRTRIIFRESYPSTGTEVIKIIWVTNSIKSVNYNVYLIVLDDKIRSIKRNIELRSSMSTPISVLIILAYRKHQHRDYTYKTVQILHTPTKLTASMYCNYNS